MSFCIFLFVVIWFWGKIDGFYSIECLEKKKRKVFKALISLYIFVLPFLYFITGISMYCILDMSRSTKRQLGKFVQYEINDLCLYRPRFYVPDISVSSRTVH